MPLLLMVKGIAKELPSGTVSPISILQEFFARLLRVDYPRFPIFYNLHKCRLKVEKSQRAVQSAILSSSPSWKESTSIPSYCNRKWHKLPKRLRAYFL